LTLDHPERRNALSVAMTDRLLEALTEVAAREEDRVVILRGTGDAFCAGADLTEAAGFPTPLAYMHRVGELVATMHELPKPTIALLTGPAVGIGANLALACDLVVASERAELCEIFSRRGLSLDGVDRGSCRGWWGYSTPSGLPSSATGFQQEKPRCSGSSVV
jgi:2-(1,2-epoxy-1,2-dihydrophenyl)acetyl-CoA isomerase